MSCPLFEDLPDGTPEMREHLQVCPECAGLAEALEALRSEPPEVKDVDFAAVRANIRRGIEEQGRRVRWLPVLLAVAAVLVLLLWRPWVRPGVEVVNAPAVAGQPLPDGRGSVTHESVVPGSETPGSVRRGSARRRPEVPIRAATVRERKSPQATVPQPDPALEAALQDFLAAERAPPPVAEPSSPVEIKIVSGDPNVVLILLKQTSGASYE